LKDSERRDILEICDGRCQRRSLILTSQMPIAHWHEQIGDPTIADSILDRLVIMPTASNSTASRCAKNEVGNQTKVLRESVSTYRDGMVILQSSQNTRPGFPILAGLPEQLF